uniref:NADPH--hemoprotein reductase n=4 Tax=Timema TaxID=61471 RepID=A0A7R9K5Z0_TIMGE|nr:unnamed protein product [Timema genevievae]
MAGEPDLTSEQMKDEPMFGILDITLLLALVGMGAWWLLKNKKKTEEPVTKSYSIQPTAMTTQVTNNSFIKKLKSSGRSLVVFYGSQTGTGEEFAGRIAKEGMRYHLKGMVADPEECEMEDLINLKDIPNSLAVFCLATYGEGDPTDNAMEFYEWLQNGDADLTGLNYSFIKLFSHYLSIEEDFITWKDRFWPAVCDFFGIESTGEDVSVRQYKLTEHEEVNHDRVYTGEVARLHSLKNQRPPFDAKNPFLAKIKVNRELHKSGERSCMHIEFDIEGSKMRYETGDHVAVYPQNNETLVNRLGELLGVNLDTVFTLTNTDEESSKKHPFPCPCSYRTALTYYIDIACNPRTHIIKELIDYTMDPKDQEHLKLMSSTSTEGKQLFSKWVTQDNRNIVHILEDLPTCRPALDHLCELLPRLQPRYYSISSSPKVYPNSVHVTAVLVEYETPTGRTNKGVATTWLAAKKPKDDTEPPLVPIFIRRSQFRLPTRTQTPIIMIGPGTGLAPFRGFVQERNQSKEEGKPVGDTILYFGCRKKAEDFIYEEELTEYVNKGVLKMNVAFSRDQKEKVYVTHLLENTLDEIWRVIGEHNGHLYVCGDARNMARDVHNIVLKVVQEKGNMTEADALAYVKKMEAQKRYSADVWS